MTRKILAVYFAVSVLLLIICGCSSFNQDPIISSSDSIFSLPEFNNENPQDTNRQLLGLWNVTFLENYSKVVCFEDRYLNGHYNVTYLLPPPGILINSFDPVTHIIDIDVTITNPYAVDANDVRFIVYTDSVGHRLLNEDNWTGLYDIPGGLPINPFIAYAKDQPDRVFNRFSQHTERLLIYLPGNNPNVNFAIDASFPGNCEEPYMIDNFTQETLYHYPGASADISVDVHDWQNNVNNVFLYCPVITGEQLTMLTHTGGTTWGTTLVNNNGAPSGTYVAYFLAGSTGTNIPLYDEVEINVSFYNEDPSNPQIVGTYKTTLYRPTRVRIYGEYAYVNTEYDLLVYNISNPENPAQVGMLEEFTFFDIAFQGDYAYTTCQYVAGLAWIAVLDISDRSSPVLAGYETAPFNPYLRNINVRGDYVYYSVQLGNMRIVDVSDPNNPEVVKSFPPASYWIDVAGDYAYAVSGSDFHVLDLSDPLNPVEVAQTETDGHFVEIQGDYAYSLNVMFNESFSVIDISDPLNPVETGTMAFPDPGEDMVVRGDYAYIVSHFHGLYIVDISDPSNPYIIGDLETDQPYGVDVYDHYAIIADTPGGLKIVDVSDPANPVLAGVAKSYDPFLVGANRDYVFTCENTANAVSVIDIADPTTPLDIGYLYESRGNVIHIDDNLAYLGIYRSGGQNILIMDVTDPVNPVELGLAPLPDWPYGLTVKNGFAYVSQEGYFTVVDVTDPGNPQTRGSVSGDIIQDSDVAGNYAYLADYDFNAHTSYVRVINISDPDHPVQVNQIDADKCYSIAIDNEYLFVGNVGDLCVYTINDPVNPSYITSYPCSGYIKDIEISGDYAYFPAFDGIKILDISDPSALYLYSQVESEYTINDLVLQDNYLHAVAYSDGLMVIQLW